MWFPLALLSILWADVVPTRLLISYGLTWFPLALFSHGQTWFPLTAVYLELISAIWQQ